MSGEELLTASGIGDVRVEILVGVMPGIFRAPSSSSHTHRVIPASAAAFPEESMPRW